MSTYSEQTAATSTAIVRAIRELTREKGYPPSYRDIGKRVGVSVARVGQLLPALRDAGRVAYEPRQPRTLRAL